MMASISNAEMRGPCRVQVVAAIPIGVPRPVLSPESDAAISCAAEPIMANSESLCDLRR
jgi:hypothetical protein